MARSRVVRFGPGSLESVELRQWLRPRTNGAILVSEIRGTFTVYCGAGNEHTVPVEMRVETHSATHLAESEQLGSLALGARAGSEDDAYLLAHELVNWALEDWADPCAETLSVWCGQTTYIETTHDHNGESVCDGCGRTVALDWEGGTYDAVTDHRLAE